MLWIKRLKGDITLKEQIEMDEIINRDALVRQFVLEEMEDEPLTHRNDHGQYKLPHTAVPRRTLTGKIRSFLNRSITFSVTEVPLVPS